MYYGISELEVLTVSENNIEATEINHMIQFPLTVHKTVTPVFLTALHSCQIAQILCNVTMAKALLAGLCKPEFVINE
jgi:hypothetical protein